MEQSQSHLDASDAGTTPPLKSCTESHQAGKNTRSAESCGVRVRKNSVTTRISAKPPHVGQATRSSSSPSSEFRYDESSASSSICTSTTPASGNTGVASDKVEENNSCRPSYMSLTESRKAKQRINGRVLHRTQRQSMDEFQFKRAAALYNAGSKSSAGSDPSINFSRPIHLSTQLDNR